MKTLILLFTLAVGQPDDKYTEQMTKNIQSVYKAQTTEEYQQAINLFERIGNAEKDKWEPFYYAGFGYIMMATRQADGGKKDALLDQARAELDKAAAISPTNSEILALEGFIHMIRIGVDPAARGPQYSMMSMQALSKAIAADPKNPRALAFMAQLQVGTAKFFNQAPAEACETARKAKALFAEQANPDNSVAPRWGNSMNEEVIQGCK